MHSAASLLLYLTHTVHAMGGAMYWPNPYPPGGDATAAIWSLLVWVTGDHSQGSGFSEEMLTRWGLFVLLRTVA